MPEFSVILELKNLKPLFSVKIVFGQLYISSLDKHQFENFDED